MDITDKDFKEIFEATQENMKEDSNEETKILENLDIFKIPGLWLEFIKVKMPSGLYNLMYELNGRTCYLFSNDFSEIKVSYFGITITEDGGDEINYFYESLKMEVLNRTLNSPIILDDDDDDETISEKIKKLHDAGGEYPEWYINRYKNSNDQFINLLNPIAIYFENKEEFKKVLEKMTIQTSIVNLSGELPISSMHYWDIYGENTCISILNFLFFIESKQKVNDIPKISAQEFLSKDIMLCPQ